MSEVKLLVHVPGKSVLIENGRRRLYPSYERPATTAEIMEAHPKCGECRYYLAFDNGLGECNNAKQTYRCDLTPTDYCRHWEGKG